MCKPWRDEAIAATGLANRDTKDRTQTIRSLLDPEHQHPTALNLFFFPYVGSTTQGFASLGGPPSLLINPDGGNTAVVCIWTDKPTGGKKPPTKFQLVEKRGKFKIGSIARTCSHELGHNLTLTHPDKATQKAFDRLMGGKRHGYDITPTERERIIANGRAKAILKWARKSRG